MNINTSFPVNIRSYGDTDQSSGNVSGTVTYPTNLLRVTSISTGGSAYGAPSITQGSGTVSFSSSRSPAPSGFAQVFSITFQAIGSGTAAVNFSGDSRVNGATTSYASGEFTITNPNPPPTTSTTPKPSPSTRPSVTPVPIVSTTPTPSSEPTTGDDNPQPTPDPSGVVDSVTVNPSYTSATINWKVNASNPKSNMGYGTKSTALDKQAAVEAGGDGTFKSTIKGLAPGNRYYFSITGTGDGGKNGTYSGTIITNGFPVTMTITENNQPASGAQVRIGTISKSTGSNGKLSIGLAAGSYRGTITTGTASLTIDLTVEAKAIPEDGSAPATQNFTYNLTSSPLEGGPGSSTSILAFVGILLAGTVVLGLGFAGFIVYRRRKFESGGTSTSTPSSTVIIDDGYDWRQETTDASTQVQPPAPLPSPPQIESPRHNNSVYINEEEPLDMFEQHNKPTPPSAPPPS